MKKILLAFCCAAVLAGCKPQRDYEQPGVEPAVTNGTDNATQPEPGTATPDTTSPPANE